MRFSEFTAALLDPDARVPDGLTDARDRGAGRRFSIYRNNVAVGLVEALEHGFPLVRRIVGAEFFAAMAGVFWRQHPPRSPVMQVYGAALPEFIAAFPPLGALSYLPDVARLELALRQSYHAADSIPLGADRFSTLPPDRLTDARLRCAPALRLIRSAHPLYALWRSQTAPDAPPPAPGAQDVVVLRPGFDPAPHLLPAGGGRFVQALLDGAALGRAAELAGPEHDLNATVSLLIAGNAIVDLEIP